ncbi:T9SS type A sorting domain-containing protein [bacterium]|nr:T9SS type A sorting domain-containing protein [bacterium]
MPAGTVGSAEQARLIDFLNDGKALYMEGADLLKDLQGTALSAFIGCEYGDDGLDYGNVYSVFGTAGSEWEDYAFTYTSYGKADYSLDIMKEGAAVLLFRDQNDQGRVSMWQAPSGYRVISSTLVFGALKDGDGSNTKANLLQRYLSHLLASTDVGEEPASPRPERFTLYQNYPNPFNASTILEFYLPAAADVSVDIYDCLGRSVLNPLADYLPRGSHRLTLSSDRLASGRYLCRVRSGGDSGTVLMTVVK